MYTPANLLSSTLLFGQVFLTRRVRLYMFVDSGHTRTNHYEVVEDGLHQVV